MVNALALDQFHAIIAKGRDLAEKRQLALVEMQRNGRWRLFYSEAQFALRLSQAAELAQAWANLAASSSAPVAAANLSATPLDATPADYPAKRSAA